MGNRESELVKIYEGVMKSSARKKTLVVVIAVVTFVRMDCMAFS